MCQQSSGKFTRPSKWRRIVFRHMRPAKIMYDRPAYLLFSTLPNGVGRRSFVHIITQDRMSASRWRLLSYCQWSMHRENSTCYNQLMGDDKYNGYWLRAAVSPSIPCSRRGGGTLRIGLNVLPTHPPCTHKYDGPRQKESRPLPSWPLPMIECYMGVRCFKYHHTVAHVSYDFGPMEFSHYTPSPHRVTLSTLWMYLYAIILFQDNWEE